VRSVFIFSIPGIAMIRRLAAKAPTRKAKALVLEAEATEARIGIFKNVFLGSPLFAKDSEYCELAVG
jgi:hypothetical protein